MIKFEKEEENIFFKYGYTQYRNILEKRKDPLTGIIVRINKDIKNKPRKSFELNYKSEDCVFCKNRILNETPDFFNFNKLILNNSILFQNAYPYGKIHGVLVPNFKDHVKNFSELRFQEFYDGFILIKDFVKRNFELKGFDYVYINLNKGFPAGASQEHLHFQIIQEDSPTFYHSIIIEKSKEYFNKNKKFLLEEYFNEEKKERLIYEDDYLLLVSPFAPFRNNEVIGLIKLFDILNTTEIIFRKVLEKLFILFRVYEKLFNNFNFVMYISLNKNDKVFPFFRIGERKFLDIAYMELYNWEYVISTIPEEYKEIIKEEFLKNI